VGCGEGFFGGYFHKNGWKVKACDFSKYGVAKHHPELLDNFEQGDIYQILQQEIEIGKKYDLINLSNVLEHVIDPIATLTMLKNIMSSKTILRVCVPNDFSFIQHYLVNNKLCTQTWVNPPEHLSYFTPNTLRSLIQSVGLNAHKILTTFPIEYFIFNEHSNYTKDKTKGKQAHYARVKIDNLLLKKDIKNFIKYYEVAAKLENGRDIVAFITLKD